MYNTIQALSVVISLLFGTFYGQKYGFGKFKSFLITLFTQVAGFAGIFVLTWIESGFKKFGSQNAVRVYVLCTFFVWLEHKIFKVDFRKCLDFQGITPALGYGIAHLACLFPRCCFGFQYVEGSTMYKIANALTGTNQLPMQLWESLYALLLFAVLLIVAYKGKFNGSGKLIAWFQIFFGAGRFGWEFLRDNKKLIILAPMKDAVSVEAHGAVWGISNLALWAAATFIVGIITLIILNSFDKKKIKEPALNAA